MADNPNDIKAPTPPNPAPSAFSSPAPGIPNPGYRDFHGTAHGGSLDHGAIYQLLLLSKELMGHPHLTSIKTMVDAQLIDANGAAKVNADKLLMDRRKKDQEVEVKRQAERDAIAKGGPAHELLDREAADKQAYDAAVKAVAEADRIQKAHDERVKQLIGQGMNPAQAEEQVRVEDLARPNPNAIRPPGQPAQRAEDVPDYRPPPAPSPTFGPGRPGAFPSNRDDHK